MMRCADFSETLDDASSVSLVFLSLFVGMARPCAAGLNRGMKSHTPIARMQALLLEQLLADAGECRRLRAAQALRSAAVDFGDGLDDDEDAALAGWLARMLRRLEG